MLEARHAHRLTGVEADLSGVEAELKTLKIQSPRLVVFDDGEWMICELRGTNGWLRDLDGHAHRFKRLGSVTFWRRNFRVSMFARVAKHGLILK